MSLIAPYDKKDFIDNHGKYLAHEYIETEILREMSSFPLVFKGGTALRLIHNSMRYSEDLDFDILDCSLDRTKVSEDIRSHFEKLGWIVSKISGKNKYARNFRVYYQYQDSAKIKNKQVKAHGQHLFPSVKIEISECKEDIEYESTELMSSNGPFSMKVYNINSLVTGKLMHFLLEKRRTQFLKAKDI